MSDKHPYAPSTGYIVQVIEHLRKSFPSTITAENELGPPKNENYVLDILRFIGLIDQDGNKTEIASKVFSIHDDVTFSLEFGKLIETAYSDLFDLHGDDAWRLSNDFLISFFRSSDETAALTGKRQVATFRLLSAFSGHGEIPEHKPTNQKSNSVGSKNTPSKPRTISKKVGSSNSKKVETPGISQLVTDQEKNRKKDFGLSVRIEINLPSDGDQETYDRIFKSIRENLLDDY